ncbi:MAG TPA: thioredoxin domain-containing protein [Thermoleophilaceae bacterium]|nr:thioredoxin domain-containing protein [Thermoleophilaceae bacterium]
MPNRLADETSPYLLQHKDNPVDWYPWGGEALSRARDEDRPILLSIGYSACHWCHVMERESFEESGTAALMNELFVCIKLDREERPDLDSIYMEACQAMTGSGGWPLNVFLTPEQVPFYVGTYFPPAERMGMPSWRQVLEAVAHAWAEQKDQIRAGGERVVQRLQGGALLRPSQAPLHAGALDDAVRTLRSQFDAANGGFGGAPKFPPASALEFLLRRAAGAPSGAGPASPAREMTARTLHAMASGGMYDQIGGGFARYSVDAHWLVPHFEKMLYDNALLARAYLHGWQVTGEELFRSVCEETLDWALREMRGPEGGFFSALDADSEGVEGKFYVWSVDELRAALAGEPDADEAIAWFGATDRGNFEGRNIPVRGPGAPERRGRWRELLYESRARRVWPGLDDKRLCSWNALMIAALADAGAVLERADYLDAATRAAEFVLGDLRDGEGRLLRSWKDGEGKLNAYLEDHAYLLEALLVLYEASFEPRWFGEARALADQMVERFADREHGGFFETSSDHEPLVARRKDLEDHPIPSGNASAAYGLLRLAALSGEHAYEEHAVSVLRLLHELAAKHPQAFGHALQALDFRLAPVREVALVGGDLGPLERVVRARFRPHLVLAGGEPDGVPLLDQRAPVDGRPAAYVCERFACKAPVTAPEELERLLA